MWQRAPDGGPRFDAASAVDDAGRRADAAARDSAMEDSAIDDAATEDPEITAARAIASADCENLRRCDPESFHAVVHGDLAYCVRDFTRRTQSRLARGHRRRDSAACLAYVRSATECVRSYAGSSACEWLPGPMPIGGECLDTNDCGLDTDGRRLVCSGDCGRGECIRSALPGESCELAACDYSRGDRCLDLDGSGAQVCVRFTYAPLGAACGGARACDVGLWCTPEGVCEELPADGESCSLGRCASLFSDCVAMPDGSTTCTRIGGRLVAPGEPCSGDDICARALCTEGRCPSDCREGLHCLATHRCDGATGECVYVDDCHGR